MGAKIFATVLSVEFTGQNITEAKVVFLRPEVNKRQIIHWIREYARAQDLRGGHKMVTIFFKSDTRANVFEADAKTPSFGVNIDKVEVLS